VLGANAVQIRLHRAPEQLRPLLQAAGAYAAYARAYLDPELFPLARFYEITARERQALLMHARGGLGNATFALGDPGLIELLLRLHPGPRQTFLTCQINQSDALLVSHNLWHPQTMLRMQVSRQSFHRQQSLPVVRRLRDADANDLNYLYAIEGDGLRYSGHQISDSIYYGAHNRGRLIAAAGTHVVARREGVGVVGNVFTHPDFRARGYGTAVTAAVTEHLLEACDLVVLNVDPANRTARHVYETLGYWDTGRLVEAVATRREVLSPLAFLRRSLGRWRAQAPETELVRA
jgi:RimJ/RimL family protein N-acetyltransferase